MNASTVVSASALVACTSLFAVFYAVENSSVDVGDMYYGTISDKSLGDVKFSRMGNERSLYYVDPESQRTVLLSNDYMIQWDAEGDLVDCTGASTMAEEATASMFPGDVGGDATIGSVPASFIPSIPTKECRELAMAQIYASGSQKGAMAEYARALKEEDTSEYDANKQNKSKLNVAFAELALLAYEEPDNERVLHGFGEHAADIYGFEINNVISPVGACQVGDCGAMPQRFGVFKDDTGHNVSTYTPYWHAKGNAQGYIYKCIFTLRGTDDQGDAVDDANVGWVGLPPDAYDFITGYTWFYVHRGFRRYCNEFLDSKGQTVSGDWAGAMLSNMNSATSTTGIWSNGSYIYRGSGNTGSNEVYRCGRMNSTKNAYGVKNMDGVAGYFVTGHSLGGGAACVFGARSGRRATVYGYAAPQAVRKSWMWPTRFNQGMVNGYRFYHKQDPVTSAGVPRCDHRIWFIYMRIASTTAAGGTSVSFMHANYYDRLSTARNNKDKNHDFTQMWTYSCRTYMVTSSNDAKKRTKSANSSYYDKHWDCREGDKGKHVADIDVVTSSRSDMRKSQQDPYHFETMTATSRKTLAQATPKYQIYHYWNQNNGYWASVDGKNATIKSGTTQYAEFAYSSYQNGKQSDAAKTPWAASCWRTHSHNKNRDSDGGSSAANYGYASKGRFNQSWENNWVSQTAHKNSNSYNFYSNNRKLVKSSPKDMWIGNHVRNIFSSNYHKSYRLQRSSNNVGKSNTGNGYKYHDGCYFKKYITAISAAHVNYGTEDIEYEWSPYGSGSTSTCFSCHSSQEVYALQMNRANMPGHFFWSYTNGNSSGTVGAPKRHIRYSRNFGGNHDDDDETNNFGLAPN